MAQGSQEHRTRPVDALEQMRMRFGENGGAQLTALLCRLAPEPAQHIVKLGIGWHCVHS